MSLFAALVAPLCLIMIVRSIYVWEKRMNPDLPATCSKVAFVCLIGPTLAMIWWAFR
jgi:hypothetical protein